MLKKCLIVSLICLTFVFAQAQASHTSYSGTLDDQSASQDYKITLKSGDAVLMTSVAQDGSDLDTYLTVYDPDGNIAIENDDASDSTKNSRIAFVAQQSGVYRVNVARYDNSTSGAYQLDITLGAAGSLDYEASLSGPMLTRDTQHFRFHYTTTGADAVTPSFLDAISRAFEDAWHLEIDKMGWPAPPSDTTMGGGSDLYDVYVQDVVGKSDEALGYTTPNLFVGDNPNTPEIETTAATSSIAIDNDFHNVDFNPGQDAVTEMRTTAFHEFNHALQFGFDGDEPANWLLEASATWMETAAAGKDQDATGYVSLAYQYPELCLGTTDQDDSIIYGEWPFMQLLIDDFGKNAVLNLWRQIATYDSFDAVQHYLQTVGTTVPREAARYNLKNLARDYKLAPQFKATVWLENTINGTGEWTHGKDDTGVQQLGASYFAFDAPPGSYDLELRDDDHTLDLWAIGVTKDNLQAIDLGRGGGIDTRNYQYTYLMVFNPTYTNDLSECSSTDYRIRVMRGKGTTNPVESVWNRANFEPLKAQS